jgi:hypothetical protein
MDNSAQIVYADPGIPGYHPVFHMVRLAARLLGARLVVVPSKTIGTSATLRGLLPRRRRGSSCLVICPGPGSLSSLLRIDNWRHIYGNVVAWVFDSFWPDHIPRFARMNRVFDSVFVTEQEDIDTWRKTMRVSVEWLPWGADVLYLGSANPEREFDVIRIGRQPPDWEDDSSSAHLCRTQNLSFHGRPPISEDATQNERSLMETVSRTKFALAFSNLVSPSIQTHPRREYITGRWTTSLAAGATIAGIHPRTESVKALLWDEALLDLGTLNRSDGLLVIKDAVRVWHPSRARLNYLNALQHLDWRWRFKKLAQALGITSSLLDEELRQINQVVNQFVNTEQLSIN